MLADFRVYSGYSGIGYLGTHIDVFRVTLPPVCTRCRKTGNQARNTVYSGLKWDLLFSPLLRIAFQEKVRSLTLTPEIRGWVNIMSVDRQKQV